MADALRNRLSQVNWGRNELGLPLFSDNQEFQSPKSKTEDNLINGNAFNINQGHLRTNVANENKIERPETPHSILNIENYSSSRPLLHSQRDLPSTSSNIDRDENKYKRKTPQEIFNRWTRRMYSPSARPPWRRTWFLVLSGFVIFSTIIYLMYVFGRRSGSVDDMLDMKNNPNLHYEK